MQYLDQQTYEKIKNLRICLITGIGNVERADKGDLYAEEDTLTTSRELLELLLNEGYKYVDYFTVTEKNIAAVKYLHPDVFLNIVEGVNWNFSNLVFEEMKKTGSPITGSTGHANVLTTNKQACKKIFEKYKIPSPLFFVIDKNNLSDLKNINSSFPFIVKPNLEDGSTGITQKSVVKNSEELQQQVKLCLEIYHQPLLIEKYIDSRELSVSMFEEHEEIKVLPIAELIYQKTKKTRWNIYDFNAKWLHYTQEYQNTPCVAPPSNLSANTEEKIKNMCRLIFRIFKMQDYGRIDIRYDEAREIPYVIDVNTNPSLEIDKKYSLTVSVDAAGLNMAQFSALIIKSAIERQGKKI